MKFLYFLVIVIMSFTIYSCGDDNTSVTPDKCPDKCQDNASCNTDTNKCVCNAGFVAEGDKCVAEVVDLCKDVTCTDDSTCDATDGKCVCDTGFVEEGDKCVVSNLCKDVTCTDDATCDATDGDCKCDAGFIAEGDKCVLDLCKEVTCSSNASCNQESGLCACDSGYFYSDEFFGCIEDKNCNDITCDDGYSCLSGNCYLDDECSVENPTGVCPTIDNQIILVCDNGLCITQNDGDIAEGKTCEPNTNNCIAGTVCIDSFQNHLYKCRAFCDLTTDNSCGNEGVCAPYLDDIARNTGICIKSDEECSNNQDTCPDEFECADMINARVCKSEGDGKLGDDCDNDVLTNNLDSCEDGLFCVGDEGDMTCQELCDPENTVDNCDTGRCIALNDLEASAGNNDIGLCLEIPNICLQEGGVKDNPACTEDDAVCLGEGGDERGLCFVDECNPSDDTCEGDTKCTRSFTSKNMCILAGTLGYGATNCVNPQDSDNPENLTADELCAQGLNCVPLQGSTSCVELCDPNLSDPCVNDENATCFDLSNIPNLNYPSGLNGACMGFK